MLPGHSLHADDDCILARQRQYLRLEHSPHRHQSRFSVLWRVFQSSDDIPEELSVLVSLLELLLPFSGCLIIRGTRTVTYTRDGIAKLKSVYRPPSKDYRIPVPFFLIDISKASNSIARFFTLISIPMVESASQSCMYSRTFFFTFSAQ